MQSTSIEWADVVWNPVTGCTKVSDGCRNCYAERISTRFHRSFRITIHTDRLDQPLRWRKSRRVFVNSMGDLFHKDVPDGFIVHALSIMREALQHWFFILTKRPERMRDFMREYGAASPNVWLGVSVENQETADARIPALMDTAASFRFVSVEPMLGPTSIVPANPTPLYRRRLSLPDWVICGGESGPASRPILGTWVSELQTECGDWGIPFFFKQWGGRCPKQNGRLLNGREYLAFPEVLNAQPPTQAP